MEESLRVSFCHEGAEWTLVGLVANACLTLRDPMDCGPLFHWKDLVAFSWKVKWKWKSLKSCLTLCNPMDCLWNSPGQNTGEGSLSLLQGIFLTQESNQCLLQCRWILYHLSYEGSPCFMCDIILLSLGITLLGKVNSLIHPWMLFWFSLWLAGSCKSVYPIWNLQVWITSEKWEGNRW